MICPVEGLGFRGLGFRGLGETSFKKPSVLYCERFCLVTVVELFVIVIVHSHGQGCRLVLAC